MKILYKIGLVIILLTSIILSSIIWHLNNSITILEHNNIILKDSLSSCINKKDKYFKFERISAATSILSGGDIQLGNDFAASVLIAASNYTTKKPIVIIGDSINENNELFCNLDTFYAEGRETVIKRRFLEKGEKKIYGNLRYTTIYGEDFYLYFDIDNIIVK